MPLLSTRVPARHARVKKRHDALFMRRPYNMSNAQPSAQLHASDIHNSVHHSHFAMLVVRTLTVGLQHPDDKRKVASAYESDQKQLLVQEFRSRQMDVQSRHYPTQKNLPKKASPEYKREVDYLKDNFDAKQKLIERMTKMMHDMIDLSEEHAYLCEIPGWNNQTYLQNVHISRQAEPYYRRNVAQLPPPVAHPHLARRKDFIENMQSEAAVSQQLSIENAMSSMAVVNGNYVDDYWSGRIIDQSKMVVSDSPPAYVLSSSVSSESRVPKIPTNSASAESSSSAESSVSDESEEEEQDEWMTVYRKCFFPEVGGMLDGIYYETYGGGPQGGFVETADLSIFEVSRTWFQTWKVRQLPPNFFLKVRQSRDYPADVFAPECRLQQHRLQASGEDVRESTSSSSDDSEKPKWKPVSSLLRPGVHESIARASRDLGKRQ